MESASRNLVNFSYGGPPRYVYLGCLTVVVVEMLEMRAAAIRELCVC